MSPWDVSQKKPLNVGAITGCLSSLLSISSAAKFMGSGERVQHNGALQRPDRRTFLQPLAHLLDAKRAPEISVKTLITDT
jgi:hypothetical protein